MYFITLTIGWANCFIAYLFDKKYYPLRSYLVIFQNQNITNLDKVTKNIFYFSGHKAHIVTSIPYKLIDDLFFIVIATILVSMFYMGYTIIEKEKISQVQVLKWSVIFAFLIAFAIPSHSSDLYGYIARGAQQSLYNQNPYTETVNKIVEYNSHPLFASFIWFQTPTTYGPVFIYLTKAIVYLSNNNFIWSFINFKFMNLTVFLFLLLLLAKIGDTKIIYLIAWNPFILIQGLWNCHNDLLSGVTIFIGLYLIQKNKPFKYFWAMFYLIIGAGIKFVSLLIIPFVLLNCIYESNKSKALINSFLGLLSGLILVFIFSLDYIQPLSNFLNQDYSKITDNISLVHKSLIAALFTGVKYYCNFQNINCNLPFIQNLLKYVVYSLFMLFYFYLLLKKNQDLYYKITLILLVFFGFTIAKFHSWYLLNLIVLIPFLNDHRIKKILIVLSMTHTYAITFLDQAKILNFTLMTLVPILFILIKERKSNTKLYPH